MEDVKKALEEIKKAIDCNTDIDDSPIITLARAFRYEKNEQQSELIVRVPHILAQYIKDERKCLSLEIKPENEFKRLFSYFNESVISDCNNFVELSFLIKPTNIAQLLNRSIGEMTNIKEFDIHFGNYIDLDEFFENHKILLLKTKNAFLSSLHVYQTLQNKPSYSSHESFLFFKFDCLNQLH